MWKNVLHTCDVSQCSFMWIILCNTTEAMTKSPYEQASDSQEVETRCGYALFSLKALTWATNIYSVFFPLLKHKLSEFDRTVLSSVFRRKNDSLSHKLLILHVYL